MKLVRLAREAELLAGTVTGLSDQGTILFAERNKIVHANFFEDDKDEDIEKSIKLIEIPNSIKFLVVNSQTPRCLSGAARIDYSIPRFANSISLLLLQIIHKNKTSSDNCTFERIADIPKIFSSKEILSLIEEVPSKQSIESIKNQYPLLKEKIESAFDSYLQKLCDLEDISEILENIPFRGPILFSISECARALKFKEILEDYNSSFGEEKLDILGKLMNIGHDGDRCDGDFLITDETLNSLINDDLPIYFIPGAFKASTPALDCIQNILISNGAVGASLTGAGLGGCVISIFKENDWDFKKVSNALKENYFDKEGKDYNNSIFEANSVQGACFIKK